MNKQIGTNPIIYSDFPDPDVIRVGDTYLMVSTTMHFMPCCVLLRSYDLLHWEILSYVGEYLEDTPGERLADRKGVYGRGMWAASLRYRNGKYYVCFVANDTHKTYLFTAQNPEGPWEKQTIEGFYHDNSILFDDDGRIYIAYGNREIYITELNDTLSGPKEGGFHKRVVCDTDAAMLGYEGTHFYKINGKYYLFFIHWPRGGMRTESCFVADSLEGTFRGRDVLCSDLDGRNSGVAQGGIVDTPEGKWYSVLFQDHGAVGRIPVLVPVSFQDDFPVFGVNGIVPKHPEVVSLRPDYVYEPLVTSDDFSYSADENGKISLKKQWQWNHMPDNEGWRTDPQKHRLLLTTRDLRNNLVSAVNTLTQRTVGERCAAEVTVYGNDLKDGDYAGICALQGAYSFLALHRENGRFFLSLVRRNPQVKSADMGSVDELFGEVLTEVPAGENVTLRMDCDFSAGADRVWFSYRKEAELITVGEAQPVYFRLDHFVGCRVGLFCFSTKASGGTAGFSDFKYLTEFGSQQ